jgi:hypothetical protein
MTIPTHPDLTRIETLSEREENFPMQEQALYPVMIQNERPAADILAERLAEGGSGAASPFFLP